MCPSLEFAMVFAESLVVCDQVHGMPTYTVSNSILLTSVCVGMAVYPHLLMWSHLLNTCSGSQLLG